MNLYNDNDPFCCDWLAKLSRAGEIPEGTTDGRPIQDIGATDLVGFAQCHFFAGVGGWPIALRLAGWPEEQPVWTGSCPCQPISCAGQRRGEKDERHLWPEFYRLISERKPPTIFGEQVGGPDGLEWLDGVSLDLEDLGYAVGAADLPAASVGAPHRRQRLFWVAHTPGKQCERSPEGAEPKRGNGPGLGSRDGALAHAGRASDERRRGIGEFSCEAGRHEDQTLKREWDGDAARSGSEVGGAVFSDRPRSQPGRSASETDRYGGSLEPTSGAVCPMENTRHRDGQGFKLGHEVGAQTHQGSPHLEIKRPGDSGIDLVDHSTAERCEVREHLHGELRGVGLGERREFGAWSNFELIACLDSKARRIEPGTFPLAARIPRSLGQMLPTLERLGVDPKLAGRNRKGRLRGYGNAIVPQVAALFIRAFMSITR